MEQNTPDISRKTGPYRETPVRNEPDWRRLEDLKKKYPLNKKGGSGPLPTMHFIRDNGHPEIKGSGEYNLFIASLDQIEKAGISLNGGANTANSIYNDYKKRRILINDRLIGKKKDGTIDSLGFVQLDPGLFQESDYNAFLAEEKAVLARKDPKEINEYYRKLVERNFERSVRLGGVLVRVKSYGGKRTYSEEERKKAEKTELDFYTKLYSQYEQNDPANWRLSIIRNLAKPLVKNPQKTTSVINNPNMKNPIPVNSSKKPKKSDVIYHKNMPMEKLSWFSLSWIHGKKNMNWVLDLLSRRLNNNPNFSHYSKDKSTGGKLPRRLLYPDSYRGRVVNSSLEAYKKESESPTECFTYARRVMKGYKGLTFEKHMKEHNYWVVHKEARGDDNHADSSFGHGYIIVGLVDMETLAQSDEAKRIMKRDGIKNIWQFDKKYLLKLALKEKCFTWAETGENDPHSGLPFFAAPAHRAIKDYFHESGWYNMKNGKDEHGKVGRILKDPEQELLEKYKSEY